MAPTSAAAAADRVVAGGADAGVVGGGGAGSASVAAPAPPTPMVPDATARATAAADAAKGCSAIALAPMRVRRRDTIAACRCCASRHRSSP